MNDENLKPCTPENARERQLKSAEKRKENNGKPLTSGCLNDDGTSPLTGIHFQRKP